MFDEKLPLTAFPPYQNSSGYARISPPGLMLLATASREKENLFLKSEYFYFSFKNVPWLSQFYVGLWTECVFQFHTYDRARFQYGFYVGKKWLRY